MFYAGLDVSSNIRNQEPKMISRTFCKNDGSRQDWRGTSGAPSRIEADRSALCFLTGYLEVWRKSYTRDEIVYVAPMIDEELVKKLEELENKQWADRVLAEIRSQMKEYEYQIVF